MNVFINTWKVYIDCTIQNLLGNLQIVHGYWDVDGFKSMNDNLEWIFRAVSFR